jgi:hypothetical protein
VNEFLKHIEPDAVAARKSGLLKGDGFGQQV